MDITVAEYMAQNELETNNTDRLNDAAWRIEEQPDCVHIYTQDGFYIIATPIDFD